MFKRSYPEGRFAPVRGLGSQWHVWCCAGVTQVLQTGEYAQLITKEPGQPYIINFANSSVARISPSHPLWQRLQEIAKDFDVQVFPLGLFSEYVPWTGQEGSLGEFDAIKIQRKR